MTAPITFTADSTTDIITATAHGLSTGDGPAAVINIGGGMPGGLTGGATDYYFIRIDANTGKLATTNANALAGTAINITSNGTGTQQLMIGLPYRVPRVAAAGSQIRSVDSNAVWNAIVGARRSTFTRTFYPKFLIAGGFVLGTNPVNSGFAQSYNSSGSVNAIYDIAFDDGDRLIGLQYWAAGNGTADLTAGSLFYGATMGAAANSIALWSDNNRAATWALVDVGAIASGPAFAAQVLAAGAALYIQLVTNAAAYSIGPTLAIFDRAP